MEIMKNLCSKEASGKNLAYSPLSICAALGLLTFGAQGDTLNQLLGFLQAPNLESLSKFCSQFMRSLNECSSNCQGGEGPKLSFVNSVLVEKSCVLHPNFKEVAHSIFNAQVEAVDFRYKADEVRLEANRWVEGSTDGIIKDLIGERVVTRDTRIILVNALYFKGLWCSGQFHKCLTKNSEFYLLDGPHSCVQVPFMHTKHERQYISCYNGLKVLKLPYKVQAQAKTDISMYILLPNERDGLPELVEKASTNSARFLDQYVPKDPPLVRTRHFKIPKFKIRFDFEATEVLKGMGLVLPFNDAAEFAGMVNARVKVTSVIHKCFVEVDEQGTEAFAFTTNCCGGPMGYCAPPSPPPVDFVADHPFMFMIKDNNTGILLFTGYVLNPLLTS